MFQFWSQCAANAVQHAKRRMQVDDGHGLERRRRGRMREWCGNVVSQICKAWMRRISNCHRRLQTACDGVTTRWNGSQRIGRYERPLHNISDMIG